LRKKFLPFLILIIVALRPVCVSAQQKSSTSQTKDAAETELREKAYQLLETLAGQVNTMQSPENRARIGSNIAGSLWPHNEARARELFAMVQQDINTGLQVTESDDPEDERTLMVFLRLRADTINRIAKHDPELAFDFFKATALNPDLKLSEQVRAAERALETDLARQVAASSPDLALRLARKILTRGGFSDELRKIVRQLNRKHKTQAQALYKDIVQKLSEVDLAEDWDARQFALTFASSFAASEIDEESFNQLLNLFVKAAGAAGCNRKVDNDDYERIRVCRSFGPAIGFIKKVNPARAAQLEQWDTNEYYWRPSRYSELEETIEDSPIDDVLALAGKYPDMEDDIRWRAFRKALYDGNIEAARKIAEEYGNKPEQQKRMLAELGVDKERPAVTDEALAEVQRRLNEIKGAEQQVMYLASVADAFGEHDTKAALKLLNQASRIVDTMKPGREQIMSQMGLAMVYCLQKSNRGFAIMESLVPKLNELIEASAKLDGLERRYLRNGEWNMTGEGTLGALLTGLAQNAGYFGRCDFDRAVTLSAQFERTEIRMMAQLKLAQGVLAGPSRRLFKIYSSAYH
jgi:hypothetical protein